MHLRRMASKKKEQKEQDSLSSAAKVVDDVATGAESIKPLLARFSGLLKVVTNSKVVTFATAIDAQSTFKQCVAETKKPAACATAGAASLLVSSAAAAAGAAMLVGSSAVLAATKSAVVASAVATAGCTTIYNAGEAGTAAHRLGMAAFTRTSSSTTQKEPSGSGWTRGAYGDYYRAASNRVEKWSSGTSSYCGSSDWGVPASVVKSARGFGGVSLDSAAVLQSLDGCKDTEEPGDPVDVDGLQLLYRGVVYSVPDLDAEELATAVFLVFFLEAREVGVSLDPEAETEKMLRVFTPSLLGQTAMGRTMMTADETLKSYVGSLYADLRVEQLAKNKQVSANVGRFWFEAQRLHVKVDKEVDVVAFADTTLALLCASATRDLSSASSSSSSAETESDEAATLFCAEMNRDIESLTRKHAEFGVIKRYMSLIAMVRLLCIASNGTVTEALAQFVQDNVRPILDSYASTLKMTRFSRTIQGRSTCVLSGGVNLLSSALQLVYPWRRAKDVLADGERRCDGCRWQIESYMEASLSSIGVTCQACREAAKFTLANVAYAGVKVQSKVASAAVERMRAALEQRVALIQKVTPAIVSFGSEEELDALIAQRLALIRIHKATLDWDVSKTLRSFYLCLRD